MSTRTPIGRDPDSLRNATPYDYLETWRSGTKPEAVMPGARAALLHGRLADDAWPTALFTREGAGFPVRDIEENTRRTSPRARDGA